MGQRLVIWLCDNDENPTAAIYYHWSAYFKEAVYETYKVSNAILEAKKNNSDILLSVERMLEEQGGGIRGTNEDMSCVKEIYPGEEFEIGHRNNGIMTFTKEGILSCRYWSEGDVFINYKTGKIDFNVFYESEPYEIGNNIVQDLGDAGFIRGTLKSGSGYIRIGYSVCPIDMYKGLTIENIKDVVNFIGVPGKTLDDI